MAKMVITAVAAPIRPNTLKSSPPPNVEKSGGAMREAGTTAIPGVENARPPVKPFAPMATRVVSRMPRSSAARSRAAMKAVVRRTPVTATRVGALVRSPNVTGMPVPCLTNPPEYRPMKRMKRPMPTPMARFRARGIAFTTASRKPVRTSTVMTRPSRVITPMAAGQGSFSPATNWNATAAFSPMPDAMARG